jgi:hypothetical protein
MPVQQFVHWQQVPAQQLEHLAVMQAQWPLLDTTPATWHFMPAVSQTSLCGIKTIYATDIAAAIMWPLAHLPTCSHTKTMHYNQTRFGGFFIGFGKLVCA